MTALVACGQPATPPVRGPAPDPRPLETPPVVIPEPGDCCGADVLRRGLAIAERHRVGAIRTRRFTHAEYWSAIEPSLVNAAFTVREIGRSIQQRPIRAVTFGRGPENVLLWSQMHGDESTASMALADIFRFLAEAESDSLRERLHRSLTITFVPMLNPDGAELFQRENAVGVDVNRDARQLATPEARALKRIHEEVRPGFGFNLHDQNARTRAGPDGPPAAIALLAPPYDQERSYNPVRERARRVAAVMAATLEHEIPRRIAKYDDGFNPRAFGDLMQQWGTSTVLIESGALPNDPEKQRLRAVNVAAILAALDAIATRSFGSADRDWYDRLPFNTGGASDVIVRGGQLVLPGLAPVRVDVAINYDDPVARTGGRIREAGDLREAVAVDTIEATGLFLHPASGALHPVRGSVWLRVGARAVFDLRRSADPAGPLVRRIGADPPPS